MCVYCNRSQTSTTSQHVKNNGMTVVFTRCDVFCDLLQYTHVEKCDLFVLYNKNSKVYWRILDMKKEKQVCWHDLTCPLIDHCQQPMKIHTEVMLSYKYMLLFLEHLSIVAQNHSFSSYPGVLYSGDDFYMLSSGLVLVYLLSVRHTIL